MYRNKLPHVGKHALVYRCNECLAGRIHQALQSGVGGLLVSYTRHCTKASYNVPCRPSRARSVMCANLRWRSMLGGNRVATFVWSIGSVGYRWHCRLRLHALSHCRWNSIAPSGLACSTPKVRSTIEPVASTAGRTPACRPLQLKPRSCGGPKGRRAKGIVGAAGRARHSKRDKQGWSHGDAE
jgi:hypothetical protein